MMDVDSEPDSKIDGNHNVQKDIQQRNSMSFIPVSQSIGDALLVLQPSTSSGSKIVSGEIIDLISDSDDDQPQKPAQIGDNSFQNPGKQETSKSNAQKMDIDTPGPSKIPIEPQPSTSTKMEEEWESPIPKRVLRSNRQPITYCEDVQCDTEEPSTSAELDCEFSKTATKSIFNLEPSQIPRNDDKKVFYSNVLYKSFCFLCEVTDKKLANHYAKKHPETEVFIARVSPTMAEKIRENKTDFVCADRTVHGMCFFCEEPKGFTKETWMKHICQHVGEQLYFCSGCNTSLARDTNHGHCSKDTVKNVFQIDSPSEDLCGWICNTCNYLQIRENLMVRHLDQHDDFNATANEIFSRVTLVKFSS